VGGFPQWFEKKLFELYPSKRILQPFGGMSEHGDLMDINPEVKPLFVGDAHYLPIADNTYDFVLLDPPYSVNLSGKLYNTGALHYYKYTAEAVRVCKPGGFIGTYHWFITARPIGTEYDKRIVILTRIWHHPRICTVFQKI
jgi:ubiquinone/menaquinone biosynthesis C-methylase UbiE